MGEQVLPTRDRSALRHLQGSGLLHSTQPVSVFTELLVFPHVLPFSYSFMYKRYRSLTMNWWRHFRHVLHKYANEDVSLGSWFIGLDVEHVDDRRLCCGTPPGTPDASPSVLAYLFPLPESVGVCMWCQWDPPNCTGSWPFAYSSIRDLGSVWDYFGKLVCLE